MRVRVRVRVRLRHARALISSPTLTPRQFFAVNITVITLLATAAERLLMHRLAVDETRRKDNQHEEQKEKKRSFFLWCGE